jgi:hypothetical protein
MIGDAELRQKILEGIQPYFRAFSRRPADCVLNVDVVQGKAAAWLQVHESDIDHFANIKDKLRRAFYSLCEFLGRPAGHDIYLPGDGIKTSLVNVEYLHPKTIKRTQKAEPRSRRQK